MAITLKIATIKNYKLTKIILAFTCFYSKSDLFTVFFRNFVPDCGDPQSINTHNMAKKVLFVNQEINPYLPESAMSIIGRDLPHKAQEAGFEIRTFMPKWGNINERRGQLHEVIRLSGMNLVIDDTDHPLIIKVASIPSSRIQVYFIDNEDYFSKRHMAEDENGNEYTDNGQRAIFFARGVLETVKKLRWVPDLIVCQGWMSAVIPFYVKTAYHDEPSFSNAKVAMAFYPYQLANILGDNFKKTLEFRNANADLLKPYNDNFNLIELSKLAIDYSDGIIEGATLADDTIIKYAEEKQRPILRYPGEDYSAAYAEFFNSLI